MTHVTLKTFSFTVTSLMLVGMAACSVAVAGTGSQPAEDLRIDVASIDASHACVSVPVSGAEELRALLAALVSTEVAIASDHETASATLPSNAFRAPAELEAADSNALGLQPMGLRKWFKAEYETLGGDTGCQDHKFLSKVEAVFFWSHLFPIMEHVSISRGQCP